MVDVELRVRWVNTVFTDVERLEELLPDKVRPHK